MFPAPEQAFRVTVRQRLAKLESQLTEVLHDLITYRYPPEVFALSFEVFSDAFTSGFPARAFFMNRSNCEHFIYQDGHAVYPSPVDPGLLEVEHVYPEEVEEQALAASPHLDTCDIATDEFIQWFANCWEKAGGGRFSLAATIAGHDSSREFNLIAKHWQPSYASFDF